MRRRTEILYYPHFADTHDQLKVYALRMECGPGAYSIYQRLNEFIFRQDGFSCFLNYEALACEIECDVNVLKSIINDFGLFVISEDGKEFTSVEIMEFEKLTHKTGRRISKKKFNRPYFRHYRNSNREFGFVQLFIKYGHEGTDVYWLLKEFLCLKENNVYSFDCRILSCITKCKEDLIRSVICDFGLFELVNDGTAFRCVDLDEQMIQMQEEDKRYSAAGRKAAMFRHHGVTVDGNSFIFMDHDSNNIYNVRKRK